MNTVYHHFSCFSLYIALNYDIGSSNKELLIYGLIPSVPFFLLCVLFILINREGRRQKCVYGAFSFQLNRPRRGKRLSHAIATISELDSDYLEIL